MKITARQLNKIWEVFFLIRWKTVLHKISLNLNESVWSYVLLPNDQETVEVISSNYCMSAFNLLLLREKCPNTEFFLVRMRENMDQKKLRVWKLFRQCVVIYPIASSESSQTSEIEFFAKIVYSWKPWTIFAKSSMLNVWLGSEFVYVQPSA